MFLLYNKITMKLIKSVRQINKNNYVAVQSTKHCITCSLHVAISSVKEIEDGGRGYSYYGLHRVALPERRTFFRLQVNKRVGISQV